MDLCAHGEIRAACLDCLTGRPPERPAPAATKPVGLPWAARFAGHCSGCDLAIHEGQSICRMADGTYQHDGCGP